MPNIIAVTTDGEGVSLAVVKEVFPGVTSKTLLRLVDAGLDRVGLARVADDADFYRCKVGTIARWLEEGISMRSIECHLEVKREFPSLTMPDYQAIVSEFGPFSVESLVGMLDDMVGSDADGRDILRMIYIVRERFSGDFRRAAWSARDDPYGWWRSMRRAARYSRRM